MLRSERSQGAPLGQQRLDRPARSSETTSDALVCDPRIRHGSSFRGTARFRPGVPDIDPRHDGRAADTRVEHDEGWCPRAGRGEFAGPTDDILASFRP